MDDELQRIHGFIRPKRPRIKGRSNIPGSEHLPPRPRLAANAEDRLARDLKRALLSGAQSALCYYATG